MEIKLFTIKSSQRYKIYNTYNTLKTELSENAPKLYYSQNQKTFENIFNYKRLS